MDLLHEPLSRQRKVKIALRNLRPAYRHYMEDHDARSWSDIEYYGEKFEKRLEKDQHFVEPRPKNKMIIPGAAWSSATKATPKVAVTKNPDEDQEVKEPQEQQLQNKNEKSAGKKNKKNKNKDSLDQAKSAAVSNEAKQFEQKVPNSSNTQRNTAPNTDKRTEDRPTRTPGHCYNCNSPDHLITSCPTVTCRICMQKGHTTRYCPQRPEQLQCQVCKSYGVTFDNCNNCAQLRNYLGNGQAGVSQVPHPRPQNTPGTQRPQTNAQQNTRG